MKIKEMSCDLIEKVCKMSCGPIRGKDGLEGEPGPTVNRVQFINFTSLELIDAVVGTEDTPTFFNKGKYSAIDPDVKDNFTGSILAPFNGRIKSITINLSQLTGPGGKYISIYRGLIPIPTPFDPPYEEVFFQSLTTIITTIDNLDIEFIQGQRLAIGAWSTSFGDVLINVVMCIEEDLTITTSNKCVVSKRSV